MISFIIQILRHHILIYSIRTNFMMVTILLARDITERKKNYIKM